MEQTAAMVAIGAIIEDTWTFRFALLYIAGTAMLPIVAYLPIVGEIRRPESPRDLVAGSNA